MTEESRLDKGSEGLTQDVLNTISSYVSKALRKSFGRGPESCKSVMSDQFLVVYIRGFVSPMEEILIKQGQRDQVELARGVIIQHVLEELRGTLVVLLNQEVERAYHDWNFPNNSGTLIFLLKPLEAQGASSGPPGVDLSRLESEVARITQLVQKMPERVRTHFVSPGVYIVERDGIMIAIEKALVEKGYSEQLKVTKDELEKKYFHRYGEFNRIFGKEVLDIFVDWNFSEDKSLMAFILMES